jgi:hypothetical protein
VVCSASFVELVKLVGHMQGVKDIRTAVYPGTVTLDSLQTMREKLASGVIDEIVQGLTARPSDERQG